MSFRFQDWKVYQDAREIRREIKQEVLPRIEKTDKYELGAQLKRALDSIILNIAEGAYRQTDKDFAHFLNQAHTSLNEVVACLDLCYDDGYITDEELKSFTDKSENLAKQLSSFAQSLRKA